MSATGDVYADIQSIANDGYLTIQPQAGEECVVSYITVNGGGKVKVSHYDGTNEAVIIDLSSAGGDTMPFCGQGFPVNNTDYLRVQNKNGAALIIGYAGRVTKGTS